MNKKVYTIIAAGVLLPAVLAYSQSGKYSGTDPVGTVSYALPSTSIVLDVEAVEERFYAGPYAKFANKYLGIEVRQKDAVSYNITDIRMTPYIEADRNSRFLLDVGSAQVDAAFLKLTSEGLVSSGDGSFGNERVWRFPSAASADFSDKGLTSNLTSEATTLYRSQKGGAAYNKVAVKQEVIVEKSIEKRAAETAAMIFSIRDKRMQIVTGDTDATYSGEAMGAAVAELTRLEKEYMSMFVGYSEFQTQRMTFDVIPEKGRESQLYVAFRLSETAGLLPADNISGKPVVLEIVVPEMKQAVSDGKSVKTSKAVSVVYRIPAICTVKLTDGVKVYLQGRVPVYQLGTESTFPVNVSVK